MVTLNRAPYVGVRKNKLKTPKIEEDTEYIHLSPLAESFKDSSINLPTKLTPELAEEIGIHIGMGIYHLIDTGTNFLAIRMNLNTMRVF